MKTVAIVQARMGSTRLPGKVLMRIEGQTVLKHVISRIRRSKEVDDIVIATTILPDDDKIVEEAKKLKVNYFRGSEEDVLARYYHAAKENQAEIVVRITSDCPLIDSKVIDEMIEKFKVLFSTDDVDYLSNTLERTYPRGLDLEIVPFRRIEEAFRNANKPYQREHVTPYFYENSDKFKLVNFSNSKDYSNYRWTLDTQEDLELITELYRHMYRGQHDFYLQGIVKVLEKNNELIGINSEVKQKELK
ncbi:cytidylyltransferase domain-containing protein [Desemzia incerta]|uniref:cytidylyltransferase domain-containing protein n=1 Tax=Desemzia incerta TaxID=82801 RepID=UPI00166019F0|nr:glycosyltransferase family protein [Desemzia incerta]